MLMHTVWSCIYYHNAGDCRCSIIIVVESNTNRVSTFTIYGEFTMGLSSVAFVVETVIIVLRCCNVGLYARKATVFTVIVSWNYTLVLYLIYSLSLSPEMDGKPARHTSGSPKRQSRRASYKAVWMRDDWRPFFQRMAKCPAAKVIQVKVPGRLYLTVKIMWTE